jgi:hypothetical protein
VSTLGQNSNELNIVLVGKNIFHIKCCKNHNFSAGTTMRLKFEHKVAMGCVTLGQNSNEVNIVLVGKNIFPIKML